MWATAQFLAPAILASTPVADLRSGVQLVTTLMVVSSFAAGLIGGLIGGWQARRSRPERRRRVVAHALAGPLVAAAVFVAVAWLRHQATPLRATVINLALAALGAAIAGIILARRGGPVGIRRRRAALGAALLMPVALLLGPAVTQAETGSSYGDIEKSDCTLRAVEASASASLTLASVDVGPSFEFRKEQTAAGVDEGKPWLVEVSYGATGGFKLSLGGKLLKAVGASLEIEGSGHLTLTEANEYGFVRERDADSMIRWAVSPYLSNVAALPGLGAVVRPALTTSMAPGSGFSPPPPRSTKIQLGGSVHVSVSALQLEANVELGNAVSVELKNEHGTDRNIVSDPEEVAIGFDLDGLLGGSFARTGLDLTGNGELALSFVREQTPLGRVWRPGALSLGATVEGAASAELGPKLDDISGLGGLKGLDVTVTPSARRAEAIELSVDLPSHPRTLAAFLGFVRAISPALEHKPVNQVELQQSSRQLLVSFATEANGGVTAVVGTGVEGDFEVTMGDGITFGVKLGGEVKGERLVGAQYRDRLDGWAPSTTCRARTGSA